MRETRGGFCRRGRRIGRGRQLGLRSHERRLAPAGLPGYRGRTSGHSVSNPRRNDRGSPGCQRIGDRPDKFRLSLAGSPAHADRIAFTAIPHSGGLCYGRVLLAPLLPTPPRGDAITVRCRTASRCGEAALRCSIPSPSGARARKFLSGCEREDRPRADAQVGASEFGPACRRSRRAHPCYNPATAGYSDREMQGRRGSRVSQSQVPSASLRSGCLPAIAAASRRVHRDSSAVSFLHWRGEQSRSPWQQMQMR